MRTTIVALFVFLLGLPILQAQGTITATIDNPTGVMVSMREDGIDPNLAYLGKTEFGQQFLAEDDGCIPAGTKLVFPKRAATDEDRVKNQEFLSRSGATQRVSCQGRGAKYLQPSAELQELTKLRAENQALNNQRQTDVETIRALEGKLETAQETITALEAQIVPFWKQWSFWIPTVLLLIALVVLVRRA